MDEAFIANFWIMNVSATLIKTHKYIKDFICHRAAGILSGLGSAGALDRPPPFSAELGTVIM
jgi:hypothetical protein